MSDGSEPRLCKRLSPCDGMAGLRDVRAGIGDLVIDLLAITENSTPLAQCEGPRPLAARHDDGACAVADHDAVEQANGVGDHPRVQVVFARQWNTKPLAGQIIEQGVIALNDRQFRERIEVQLKLLHVARRQQPESAGRPHESYRVLPFGPVCSVPHVTCGRLRVRRQHEHRIAGAAANCERGSGDPGDERCAADIDALAPIQFETQVVGDDIRPERIARFAHAVGDDEAVDLGFLDTGIGECAGHRLAREIVGAPAGRDLDLGFRAANDDDVSHSISIPSVP